MGLKELGVRVLRLKVGIDVRASRSWLGVQDYRLGA